MMGIQSNTAIRWYLLFWSLMFMNYWCASLSFVGNTSPYKRWEWRTKFNCSQVWRGWERVGETGSKLGRGEGKEVMQDAHSFSRGSANSARMQLFPPPPPPRKKEEIFSPVSDEIVFFRSFDWCGATTAPSRPRPLLCCSYDLLLLLSLLL